MTVAWKRIPRRHQGEAFSGEGARIAAGRWNERGTRAVYLSGSLYLAALEMLVYAGRAVFRLSLVVFRIEIPDDVAADALPADASRQLAAAAAAGEHAPSRIGMDRGRIGGGAAPSFGDRPRGGNPSGQSGASGIIQAGDLQDPNLPIVTPRRAPRNPAPRAPSAGAAP